jgi:hypothetical protein
MLQEATHLVGYFILIHSLSMTNSSAQDPIAACILSQGPFGCLRHHPVAVNSKHAGECTTMVRSECADSFVPKLPDAQFRIGA